MKVVSISLQDNQTVLTLSYNNRMKDGGYYSWFTLDKNAYIVANGQRYTLKRAEGIALSPDKTYFSYAGETKTFTLYFPPIPKTTKPIMTKTMIPIIVSIFLFVCYNYNIVLICKNSNIIRITYYIY